MNSVRLNPELREKAKRVAAMQGLSLSEVQRRALEAYCDAALAPEGSRYDDIIGVAEGERDLSSRSAEVFLELSAAHDRRPD